MVDQATQHATEPGTVSPSTLAVSHASQLSPLPLRIIIYLVLVLVALLAIRLIDQRAMTRMAQLEQEKQLQHEPATTQPGL